MEHDGIKIHYRTKNYIRFSATVDNHYQDIELEQLLKDGWELISHTVIVQETGLDDYKELHNQYVLKNFS